MLDRLTVADFAPHVGKTFEIETGETRVAAELAWARNVGEEPPSESGRRRAFSIALRTAPDVRLSQRIHAVQHPALGRLEIFLVPVQPDARGNLYEAIFN